MPMMTDLRELKSYLEIPPDNTVEDKKILLMIEVATEWIEQILNRPGLFYKLRTEFYDGTGTVRILLRSRPVYTTPEPIVWVDGGGFYGSPPGNPAPFSSDPLVYGVDFCLDLPEEGQPSYSGILCRLKAPWPKPWARSQGLLSPYLVQSMGNVKITYAAGYTIDTLPTTLRMACNMLVAKMRYIMPLGMETSSESYEDRSISLIAERKDYLLAGVKAMIFQHRNWRF